MDTPIRPAKQRTSAEIDVRALKDRLILDTFAEMVPLCTQMQTGETCSFIALHGARLLVLARACHTELLPPE